MRISFRQNTILKSFTKFITVTILMFAVTIVSAQERGNNGMVVSASPEASNIGNAILKKGGNAIDAAVATGFALAVSYPAAGNIGGGGFMVIRFHDGTSTTIDFREKAPLKAYKDMLLDDDGNYDKIIARESHFSSGVPGSVAGLIYALDKYGTMELKDILQPVIDLAENGFTLSWQHADSFNRFTHKFNSTLFSNNGKGFSAGDVLIQKELANTLRRISEQGRDGFYKGETADLIVKCFKKKGGLISYEDLETYQPVEREPITGKYRGYDIISMGPPSSGGIAILQALKVFEKYEFAPEDFLSAKHVHTVVEVLKHIYADRSKHLGDMDYYKVPVDELLSDDTVENIYKSVKENAVRSADIAPHNFTYNESEETTHYSLIDKAGNAVSTTVTLNSSFGNKHVVEGAGFLLNNEMDDFSAKPGVANQFGLLGNEANSIEPGKRMLSSMTPTIVAKDGKPVMVTGSPGGSTIITTVLQTIMNVVDFKMNAREAITAPRFHHQWHPDKIYYERFAFSKDTEHELLIRGHRLGHNRGLGRVELILIENGFYYGITDPRGYGKASGY